MGICDDVGMPDVQTPITREHQRKLDEDGYLVLPDFMSPTLLATLRTRIEELFEQEGDQAGAEFKQEPGCRRLANLANKGEIFREVIVRPELLAYVGHMLRGNFKLSSLNA